MTCTPPTSHTRSTFPCCTFHPGHGLDGSKAAFHVTFVPCDGHAQTSHDARRALSAQNTLREPRSIALHQSLSTTAQHLTTMATTASSSAAGAASGSKQLDPQQIQVQFQRYRTELQSLAQKIGELESEMEEHA